jgi:hypothetical protein
LLEQTIQQFRALERMPGINGKPRSGVANAQTAGESVHDLVLPCLPLACRSLAAPERDVLRVSFAGHRIACAHPD